MIAEQIRKMYITAEAFYYSAGAIGITRKK